MKKIISIIFFTAFILHASHPAMSSNSLKNKADPDTKSSQKSMLAKKSPQQTLYLDQNSINSRIIPIAKNAYEQMNHNWTYVTPRTHMSTDSEFWDAKPIKSKFIMDGAEVTVWGPTLILKTKPNTLVAALRDLVARKATVECTIASTTAQIFCMMDLLGEANFLNYVISLYTSMESDPTKKVEDFFHAIPHQFITRIPGLSNIPGSFTHISNLPHYIQFKPSGNCSGDNVFCIGDDSYVCFKPKNEGKVYSLKSLVARYFEEFIKTEDVEKNKKEHQELVSLFKMNPKFYYVLIQKLQDESKHCDVFLKDQVNDFLKTCKK